MMITTKEQVSMTWKNVTKYSLGYSIKDKQFYLYYWLEDEDGVHQLFLSPVEFVGLSEMFKNGGQVRLNTDETYFVTADTYVKG